MDELNLEGTLNLMGDLTLKGKVKTDGKEILVELSAPGPPCHGSFPPVIQPPPPAPPFDPGPKVWVTKSFNETVKIDTGTDDKPIKPIVASGLVMQGDIPNWPGMVLPGASKITASGVPVNVTGDKAIVFPSGMIGILSESGQ